MKSQIKTNISKDGGPSSILHSRSSAPVLLAAVFGLLAIGGANLAPARDLNPGIAPPNSNPHGHSYGEWTALWWQWALSIPEAINPLDDTTGQFADVDQHGPVWFVAGTFGNSVERSFTVPKGKAIFMPVQNWIFGSMAGDCDPTNPGVTCDVPTLREKAAAAATGATVVEARIDGDQVEHIRHYRAFSPHPFSITLPQGAVFGIPDGTYFPQVSDGYWLMLEPLRPGKHTIQVHVVDLNSPNGPIEYEIVLHLTVR